MARLGAGRWGEALPGPTPTPSTPSRLLPVPHLPGHWHDCGSGVWIPEAGIRVDGGCLCTCGPSRPLPRALSVIRLWLSCFPRCTSNRSAPQLHPSTQLRKCLCHPTQAPGPPPPTLGLTLGAMAPTRASGRKEPSPTAPHPRPCPEISYPSCLWGTSKLPTSRNCKCDPPLPPYPRSNLSGLL